MQFWSFRRFMCDNRSPAAACFGHGVCNITTSTCQCFAGWSSNSDLVAGECNVHETTIRVLWSLNAALELTLIIYAALRFVGYFKSRSTQTQTHTEHTSTRSVHATSLSGTPEKQARLCTFLLIPRVRFLWMVILHGLFIVGVGLWKISASTAPTVAYDPGVTVLYAFASITWSVVMLEHTWRIMRTNRVPSADIERSLRRSGFIFAVCTAVNCLSVLLVLLPLKFGHHQAFASSFMTIKALYVLTFSSVHDMHANKLFRAVNLQSSVSSPEIGMVIVRSQQQQQQTQQLSNDLNAMRKQGRSGVLQSVIMLLLAWYVVIVSVYGVY